MNYIKFFALVIIICAIDVIQAKQIKFTNTNTVPARILGHVIEPGESQMIEISEQDVSSGITYVFNNPTRSYGKNCKLIISSPPRMGPGQQSSQTQSALVCTITQEALRAHSEFEL